MSTSLGPDATTSPASCRTVHRVCPFCEATCGLAVETEGDRIVSVRGDRDDPFSRGFICPKAHGLKELHHDPERLRRPVRRIAGGWQEVSWEAAYAEVAARLGEIREKHGKDAIGLYSGNPMVHDMAFLYAPVLVRALDSRSVFNPAAIDTLPKEVQTGLMFGGPFPATIPVPDIDRTRHLLIIGANPAISHGSLMTMPDAPGRLKGVIRARRQGRSSWTRAAPRPPASPASITSSGRGRMPRSSWPWSTRSWPKAWSGSAPRKAWSNGLDEVDGPGGRVRARGGGRALRHRRPHHPAARAGIRRGGIGCLLWPTQHLRPGVRHARQLGL